MKIARVFPTKTSMSPTDPLAFFGPPTLDAIAAEPEEVHISVTFSWDLEKADELYYQWEMLGVPAEIPAGMGQRRDRRPEVRRFLGRESLTASKSRHLERR